MKKIIKFKYKYYSFQGTWHHEIAFALLAYLSHDALMHIIEYTIRETVVQNNMHPGKLYCLVKYVFMNQKSLDKSEKLV